MKMLRRLWWKVLGSLMGHRRDSDLRDEIRSHIDMQTEDNLRAGMNPREAQRQARLKFGNVEAARQSYRDQRGLPRIEAFWRDIRYGVRGLAKSPGFTTVAILMLGLGIGANTAIFSVVNTVLLQPLAYPEPDRLVTLVMNTSGGPGINFSIPEFMNFRRQTEVFQDVAAYDFGGPGVNLTGGDQPERVKGLHVSTDYFRLFGARVVAGRTFSAEDDLPGGGRLVVISHGLWRRRFNVDPDLVGRTISLGGEPHSVVGIVGPSFLPDPPADLWLPLQADPNSRSGAHFLRVAARLKPGVTIEHVNAQLEIALAEFRHDFPLFSEDANFTVPLGNETT